MVICTILVFSLHFLLFAYNIVGTGQCKLNKTCLHPNWCQYMYSRKDLYYISAEMSEPKEYSRHRCRLDRYHNTSLFISNVNGVFHRI
jgi:hypothetical protein